MTPAKLPENAGPRQCRDPASTRRRRCRRPSANDGLGAVSAALPPNRWPLPVRWPCEPRPVGADGEAQNHSEVYDAWRDPWPDDPSHNTMREPENVNRFEVVDCRATVNGAGRAFVAYDVGVELAYQDDGRTLKVFLRDREGPADAG